jgi:Iap family predicted aminopeptidase
VSPLGFLLFFFLQAGVSPSQKPEVDTLPRAVIEQRLAAFSTTDAKRHAGLKKLFEDAGCLGQHLTDRAVKGERIPNLECTLPGATDSVIIVGAHFDFRGDGQGVADNWSGAALLPSLFEGLAALPRRHTFKFVGFTEEEKGLVGSKFYAKKLTREQILRTRAMVNLDTLGLSTTRVWLSRADSKLSHLLDLVAQTLNLPVHALNMDQLGSTTDSEPFRQRRIPSITLHSVTPETRPILHTARDDWNAVRIEDYYETYRLVNHYLALLDTQLD